MSAIALVHCWLSTRAFSLEISPLATLGSKDYSALHNLCIAPFIMQRPILSTAIEKEIAMALAGLLVVG